MNKILVALGVFLILVGAAVLVYVNLAPQQPLLGSGSSQGATVDYLSFFGFALGGGGVLVLLFSFFQWYGKWRSK
jgi:hypothetical protein